MMWQCGYWVMMVGMFVWILLALNEHRLRLKAEKHLIEALNNAAFWLGKYQSALRRNPTKKKRHA
jgi:hypothetical protein